MGNLLSLVRQEPQGVRPDYGLTGAQISRQRSSYEPTLGPGETRSREDLRSMLWSVIEAAGMAAVPGAGPHKLARQAPAATRRTPESLSERAFSRAKPDDFVTLFHGTTAENARGIIAKGFKAGFSNPESGTPSDAPAGVYLAPDAKTARNYSPDGTVLAVRVKKSLLNPDNTLKTHEDARSSLYHDYQGGAWVGHGSPIEVVGTIPSPRGYR